ncbi:hypothetical protein Micbo1qcDRAFT_237634 [Microdochium bolleyi]|uniref:FAD-binding PCMH-type domain-containing protein n=1 Tax=Microdochium bolleyi TaxID=196109 RepID=A0A136IJ37_9PEZI|nr:hypothetical protein Micbo1qcDRAFT_237634 [Microdochium bolleyi]
MVAEAVSLFGLQGCPFAIRSGGHSTAEGWANIEEGVLLATTKLSGLSLGNDYVSVGPGLRWGAVYSFLDQHGLTVVGGRGAEVGVGGLALGGGVSHFTPERGFACDNIKGFQIVTSGGHIVEANAGSHPDLWQALKGTQNMFGVVTRLDLYTFPSPQLHSVSSSASMDSFDALASVYDDYIRERSDGDDARHFAVGLTSYYVPFLGPPTLHLDLLSTAGAEEGSWVVNNTTLRLPGPLVRFGELSLSNLTENRGTMAKFAAGAPTPKLRYDLRTLSFRSSVDMFKGMKRIFEEEIAPVQAADPSFSGIIEWQLVTANAIRQGHSNGGNMLGLESAGPLIVFTMANSWVSASGDAAAHAAGQRAVARAEALARELGVHVPFLYANYAAKDQDVLRSYGEKNLAKLRKVRKRYDCKNQLRSLIPGGLSGMDVVGLLEG